MNNNLLPANAIDTIVRTFDYYPIVALGEAHCLQEEHDFILSLIQHPSFTSKVNDIVVEFGNALYQDTIDQYIYGHSVSKYEFRQVWRNTINSPFDPWDAPVYEQFFSNIRNVNNTQSPNQKLRVLLGDPPIDWTAVKRREDIFPFLDQREAHFAKLIEKEVLSKNRKALMVIGSGHLGRQSNRATYNTGGLIEQSYPKSMFVIVPHLGFGALTNELEPRLLSWPVPSIVLLKNTWLGAIDATVHFQGTDFNADGIILDGNSYEGIKLEDTADAYLYLGSVDTLTLSNPPAEIYKDESYLNELKRRYQIRTGGTLDAAVLINKRPKKYIHSIS